MTPISPGHQAVARSRSAWPRVAALAILIILAAIAFYLSRHSRISHLLQDQPEVQAWVHRHRAIAPLIFVGLYLVMTLLLLPVWELQLAAGYGFGLAIGVFWCEIAAAIAAIISMLLSRWLIGQWFRVRYESRVARLHAFNEKLGHNGLLAVMGVRLCHLFPFALSNYLFGLTPISVADVGLGTLLGNLPVILVWVVLGVQPALLKDWRFWSSLAVMNLVLLVPLILRYTRPQWFKRIGVE